MTCRRGPQLPLLLLLSAAVSLEAYYSIYTFSTVTEMSWPEARRYCQEKGLGLATVQILDFKHAQRYLENLRVDTPVWVGLHRDPDDEEAWRWIDLGSDEGFTQSDYSQNGNWSEGDQGPHCVALKNQMWHSKLCSESEDFYCSSENTTEHIESNYSWDEAEEHCQNHSMTLVTVTSANSAQFTEKGWIGLQKEGNDTWKWSDGSPFEYTNWAEGEPRSRDCGSYDGISQEWNSNECSQELRPLCVAHNMVVVKLNKTWEEAVAYCSELRTECGSGSCKYRHRLMTVREESQITSIRRKLPGDNSTTEELWIGLRYLEGGWWGLRGNDIEHPALPNCPSQERCGALSRHSGTWLPRDCTERRHFICSRSSS